MAHSHQHQNEEEEVPIILPLPPLSLRQHDGNSYIKIWTDDAEGSFDDMKIKLDNLADRYNNNNNNNRRLVLAPNDNNDEEHLLFVRSVRVTFRRKYYCSNSNGYWLVTTHRLIFLNEKGTDLEIDPDCIVLVAFNKYGMVLTLKDQNQEEEDLDICFRVTARNTNKNHYRCFLAIRMSMNRNYHPQNTADAAAMEALLFQSVSLDDGEEIVSLIPLTDPGAVSTITDSYAQFENAEEDG